MCGRRTFNRLAIVLALLLFAGLTSAAAGPDTSSAMHFATLGPGPSDCPLVPASYAFIKGFRDLGYAKDAVVDQRCYSQLSDIPRVVAEILASKPPLVVVWGSIAAVRLLNQKSPTLPIVFVNMGNPVENGLVQSLARPGGNITGISNLTDDLLAKRVEILRDALPGATRLAVLCNLSNPVAEGHLRTTLSSARKLNFEAHAYSVLAPGDLAGVFDAMKRDRMDAVVLLPDALFYVHRDDIVALSRSHRTPVMSYTTAYADSGGLFIYAANLEDMSYRAAAYVDKILRGVKPGDIPVELPTTFDFIVNARTARDLGLRLPQSVLLRATRVID